MSVVLTLCVWWFFFFFFLWYGDHRDLHSVDRRQRQMFIRDRYYSFFEKYDNEVIEKKDCYRIEIHGKSYPIKDSLKQQGFHWNGECWALYTYDENFKPVIEENAKVKVVRIKMDY